MSQAGMMSVTKVWHVTVIGRVSHGTCHKTNSYLKTSSGKRGRPGP